jgi:hypothetical protein
MPKASAVTGRMQSSDLMEGACQKTEVWGKRVFTSMLPSEKPVAVRERWTQMAPAVTHGHRDIP